MEVVPKRQVTMATIAKEAGVARTTVSFVLSGQYRQRGIPEQTAQRIMRIVEARRFVPNETARSLSRRRTRMIGVFIPGFNSHWGESIVRGIRTALYEHEGYVPLIASQHDDPDWEEREIKLLVERQVEAIVCCPTVKSENYQKLIARGIPLTFIGHRAKGMPDANFVAWDGPFVAAAAVKHLISKGRRRIAYLGRGPDSAPSRERYEGYLSAMKEAGLEAPVRWKINVPDYSDASNVVHQIFTAKERPDAIISDLWIQALSALEALDEVGMRVPEDVALLALGDSPFCRHRRIGLSVVLEPAEEIGRQAAEIALQLIKEPTMPPIQRLIQDHTILDRATT